MGEAASEKKAPLSAEQRRYLRSVEREMHVKPKYKIPFPALRY